MAVKLKPDELIDVQATGECSNEKPKKLISFGITPTGYIPIGATPMAI